MRFDYIKLIIHKIHALIYAFVKNFIDNIHKNFVYDICKIINLNIEKIKTKYFKHIVFYNLQFILFEKIVVDVIIVIDEFVDFVILLFINI